MNLFPKDVIKKSYLKQKLLSSEFESFKNHFNKFKTNINIDESEEYNKNFITDFLYTLGYENNYKINTKGRVDLAIYKDNTPEVLIETKNLNDKKDMISIENLNEKSFQQIILYYLREKIKFQNFNLRHIIITNYIEWFVFDAIEINKIATNKKIERLYRDFEIDKKLFSSNTDEFYKSLKVILKSENLLKNIKFVRFNLNDKFRDKQLENIYKLLSPKHLLKLYDDSDLNSLNKNFYYELLYIMGLEEVSVKKGAKKLIYRREEKIRESGSIIESTILKLKSEFNISDEDELFSIALELNIIWLNRVLFLKLLEAKLLKTHKGDYIKFLSPDIVINFDILNTLFFEVVAKNLNDRDNLNIEKFKFIPYLNSSLFEPNIIEKKYLRISNLRSDLKLNIYNKTILKDDKRELNTLDYLLKFLNAYDFGSDESDKFKSEHSTLINSAVLGLIFEKLNGYKDGSFFTPAFVTMYMVRESLEKVVVDKFNQKYLFNCKNLDEVYNQNYDIKEANELIDSIKICDMAVGSGHFLVSALNEVLAIKSKLEILVDSEFKRLKNISLEVENDEIYIVDEDGEIFEYIASENKNFSKEVIRIQKTIFDEKVKIIENQLFGVDINQNSVNITRLRLWIELLKHSYYDANRELKTLPNIDINIKTGNSLISRYSLKDDMKIDNITYEIENYKNIVKRYKESNYLTFKKELLQSISNLTDKFKLKLKASWIEVQELQSALKYYVKEFGSKGLDDELLLQACKLGYRPSGTFFDIDEKLKEKTLKIINDLNAKIKEIENGETYKNSFDWRFEFPEVLDENGEFLGFDLMIGNPPYIMEDDNKKAFNGVQTNSCYQGKCDIWHIFTCIGIELLNEQGYLSFIAKNQWMESKSASQMRKAIYQNTELQKIIDFGVNMIFEEASQQTMILLLQKNKLNKNHSIAYLKFQEKLTIKEITKLLNLPTESKKLKIQNKIIDKNYDENENLTFSSSKNEKILVLIESMKNFEFDEKLEIIQGINGSPDKHFIIKESELKIFDKKEREFLKIFHTHTDRFYTPSSNKYIFYLSKKNFDNKNIDDYLNIKNFFEPNKKILEEAKIKYKTPNKPYFYLHRERDEKFFKKGSKIIFSARTKSSTFTFTDKPFYGSRNLFFIKSDRVNLKYMTALLNSKLFYFYMNERLKHTGDLLQIDKNQFMKIPLYVPEDEKIINDIENLVDKILKAKEQNKDIKEFEKEIDKRVYELYNLNDDEIEIILK